MDKTISQEFFYKELLDILEETFDIHHGVYLDKGTSLFDTLDQISAEDASVPIGSKCATIAAQVEHVILYLEILGRHITGEEVGEVDWGEIWSRVSGVSTPKWNDLKKRLKNAYDQLKDRLGNIQDWELNDALGGSLGILVHTAYHLGEIRQALCTF